MEPPVLLVIMQVILGTQAELVMFVVYLVVMVIMSILIRQGKNIMYAMTAVVNGDNLEVV